MDRNTVKVSLGLMALAVALVARADTFNLFQPASGVLKGDSSTYVTTAAVSSDIRALWGGTCDGTTYLRGDGSCQTPPGAGGGTVDSVALTAPSMFSVAGSPVTSTGTLALTFATGQTANRFLATPDGTTGAVALRAIVAGDIPQINLAASGGGGVGGILPGANGGTANGFTAFSGPTTSLKTFALPNASATILTTNALVTVPQGGIGVGTLTGLAKGNGTSAFTAAASADVIGLWTGTCNAGTFLRADGSCQSVAGAGTVTSVGLTAPSVFSVTGSPVTGAGSLAFDFATGQTQNRVLASPNGSSGAIALRALVGADIPVINLSSSSAGGVTGNLPVSNLNAGTGATANTLWHGNGTWSAVSLSADVTGTLADGSLSSNIPRLNAAATFTGSVVRVNSAGDAYAEFNGSGAASGTGFYVGENSTNAFITNPRNTPIEFRTNATLRGTIAAAGNWTINTPASGPSVTAGLINLHAANGLTGSGGNLYTTSTNGLYLGSSGNADVGFYTNSTGRGTISAAGAWSLNAPASGTTLTVNGVAGGDAVRVSTAGPTWFQANNTSASVTSYMGSDGGGGFAGTGTAHPFNFYTNGVDRGAVSATGNWAINAPASGVPFGVSANTGANDIYADFTDSVAIIRLRKRASVPSIGTATAHGLELSTDDIARARLPATGGLEILAPTSGVALGVTGTGGGYAFTVNRNGELPQLATSIGGSDVYFGTSNGYNLNLMTNGVERATIGPSGGLTVGAPTGGNLGAGTVNTAGDIAINNVSVCREDGTNCPAGLSVRMATGYNSNSGTSCTLSAAWNIASCSRSTTGIYVLTMSQTWDYNGGSGLNLRPCVVTAHGPSIVARSGLAVLTGNSQVTVTTYDAAGAAADAGFQINCQGPTP